MVVHTSDKSWCIPFFRKTTKTLYNYTWAKYYKTFSL
jgi:hypothetical protein